MSAVSRPVYTSERPEGQPAVIFKCFLPAIKPGRKDHSCIIKVINGEVPKIEILKDKFTLVQAEIHQK